MMNRNKMQEVLDWMQCMDLNGEWSDALEAVDNGWITETELEACIIQTLADWVLDGGMEPETMHTMIKRVEEAMK